MRTGSFRCAVFIILADKAFISERADMVIGYSVIAFVVSACVEAADIFHEIGIERMQTCICCQHGEEPA